MGSWLRAVWAIAAKDLVVEWRTKTAVMSSVVFAILVLAILYFSRDPTAVSDLDLAPGALWVTITFAAMIGLTRAFHIEHETGAMDVMRLHRVPPDVIFGGKMLSNLLFVGTVEAVVGPLFVLFYNVSLAHRLPLLLGVMLMATLAFVAVGTLLSALAVQTRFAQFMLPILLLPFLVPPVVGAVQVTARILLDRPFPELTGWLNLLVAFDVAFLAASFLLFASTIDE